MKRSALAAGLMACLVMTGCASLLERSYTTSEPHSSKFWESEAAGTLRAENAQDIVNDLLILVGQHTESAILRLYDFPDEQAAAEALEQATLEVQQEAPLGAYAVDYITYVSQSQRSFYEVELQIGYRRSAEQLQTIVNATSASALNDLLVAALDGGRTELVVRVGYWTADGRERVAQTVEQLRQDRAIPAEEPWIVRYYPEADPVGILEFLLAPSDEEWEAYLAEQLQIEDSEPDPAADMPDETAAEGGEPVADASIEPVSTEILKN